jgi:DNA polymerase I-like protein with 3'-5' exonuclease and polymerase domains
LLEVPESLACDVATRAQDIMTSWTTTGPGMPLEVPLVVDFKVGRTWGSMEKYKFTRSLPVQVAQEGICA